MKQKTPLFSNIKGDLISGIVVFLIALPLCLGIAQASGAPLFSGLVTGIVAGIIVGALSGSQVSVAGPAAGLSAIVLVAINEMGAFEIFLCSVIIGGVAQLIMGFARAGSFANYFPGSVIQGMLAGIGLTIIIKMIPDAVGYNEGESARMTGAESGFSMESILASLRHTEIAAIIIAVTGLALLFLWQTKPFRKVKMLPAGLIVVVLGVIINYIFQTTGSSHFLNENHLVNLPVPDNAADFLNNLMLPDFSGFTNPYVWQTGIVIAVVASIETLLCLEATDKLDPLKRYTPTNRELKAQGLGNIITGMIGGLPMTSVIVRSSANIHAGAKTKLSAITHGVLLLVCVVSIPVVLNLIPKAALAAILIHTGYKLCNPAMVKNIWKKGGWNQLIPFAATAIAVVSLDLLQGVGIGLIISIFYILKQNMRIPYYYQRSSFSNGELIKLTLAQEVSFLNKASIKQTLETLPSNTSVIIDASHTEYIDYDVLELIKEFYETKAPAANIKMSLIGFKNSYQIPNTAKEVDMVSELAESSEAPKRTAGDHKDLLKQLVDYNNNQNNDSKN